MSLLLVAACTSTQVPGNLTVKNNTPVPATPVTPESKALYKVTIAQSNDTNYPDYIKMDSDVYNQGEIVEFTLVNLGSDRLGCRSLQPTYYVGNRTENGSWNIVTGGVEQPSMSFLEPGVSTGAYRLDTTGWIPGQYRIVFNCGIISPSPKTSSFLEKGIFRDFTIRALPSVK